MYKITLNNGSIKEFENVINTSISSGNIWLEFYRNGNSQDSFYIQIPLIDIKDAGL